MCACHVCIHTSVHMFVSVFMMCIDVHMHACLCVYLCVRIHVRHVVIESCTNAWLYVICMYIYNFCVMPQHPNFLRHICMLYGAPTFIALKYV